jgi:acetylglutamate kinase
LVAARRRPPAVGPDGTPVDFGLVGEVAQVRCELVESLWRAGLTPVINPLGIEGGPTPHVLNINADTVASAIAGALGVDHLFVVTAAGGVRSDPADPDSIVARLTASQARAAIANGTVTGGMVPKLQGALDLLDTGVAAIHIVGPRPGALAPAVPGGVAAGTVIVADSPADVAVSRGPLQHPGPG